MIYEKLDRYYCQETALFCHETPEFAHSPVLLSPTLNIIDSYTDATWSSSWLP